MDTQGNKTALLIIDMLRDFGPGGSLEVGGAADLVEPINELQRSGKYDCIVLVQDYHPADHCSYQVNGGVWPVHCQEGTPGAEFLPGLDLTKASVVIRKGRNPAVDSYSAFLDNDKIQQTGLDGYLQNLGIDVVDVCGVALDYCCRFTAEDAADLGYMTTILKDLVRAVHPEDTQQILEDLRKKNIQVL